MNISIELTSAVDKVFPGSLIKGNIVIETSGSHEIDYVEVELHPPFGEKDSHKINAQISKRTRVHGRREFPFAVTIPQNASDPKGIWKINAKVSDEVKVHVCTVKVEVDETVGTKVGNVFWGLLFALGFLVIGSLGMSFGIGGHPDKIIPEGVLWFAFGMGLGAVLIARAIMGSEDRGAPIPFMKFPVIFLLFGMGAIFLYMGIIDVAYTPLRWIWDFRIEHLAMHPNILQIFSDESGSRTVMSFTAASALWVSLGGLISRRKVPPSDLMLVVILSASSMVVPFVVYNYAYGYPIGTSAAVFGIMGLVSVWWVIRNPVFTRMPTVMITSGMVPVIVGVVGILQPEAGIPSGIVLAWGLFLGFLGSRNLLSSSVASVQLTAMPTTVGIGNTVHLHAVVAPKKNTHIGTVTARLRCSQTTVHYVGSDRRYNTNEVYSETFKHSVDKTVTAGQTETAIIPIIIPLGQMRSNTSDSNTITWQIDVNVGLKGAVDWVEEIAIDVV